MQQQIYAGIYTLLLVLHSQCHAMPFSHSNDIDDGAFSQSSGGGSSSQVDYNTVIGHFKDFLMYLPVMMTTIKETMTGFPKFAKGVRILTSRNDPTTDDDCKCKKGDGSSNEIENSSRYV